MDAHTLDFKTVVFFILSAILLLAAVRVITARNPVHAALYLVLAFFTSGGIWVLLQAEFLAITLVLVYVGAVMVLFLFVVMMLDINIDRLREGFWQQLPLGLLVGGLMVVEMALVLFERFSTVADADVAPVAANASNIKDVGRLLYSDYLYPFELASVVLLVAMIVAIALTFRGRKKTKVTDPAEQIAVRAADRFKVLKMPAEIDQ